jgi:hypothetical protein
MRRHFVLRVLKFVLFAVLFVVLLALFGFFVKALWNWLMPGLFGWKTIGYWQAVGIIVLSKILFGGFRAPRGGGGRWRHRMSERWEQMTPEEREKFRQGLHGRWGREAAPDSKPSA